MGQLQNGNTDDKGNVSGKRMGALATACNLGQFSCTLLSGCVLALGGGHPTVFAVAAVIAFAGAVAAALAHRKMDGD